MNIYAAKLAAGVPKCVTQLLERVTSFTHWAGRVEGWKNGRMEGWNETYQVLKTCEVFLNV